MTGKVVGVGLGRRGNGCGREKERKHEELEDDGQYEELIYTRCWEDPISRRNRLEGGWAAINPPCQVLKLVGWEGRGVGTRGR